MLYNIMEHVEYTFCSWKCKILAFFNITLHVIQMINDPHNDKALTKDKQISQTLHSNIQKLFSQSLSDKF